MAVVVRLISLFGGPPTKHDGRFLKAYDPTWREKPGPDGQLVETLETVAEKAAALQFRTLSAAMEFCHQISPNKPVLESGKPNIPLAAYNLDFSVA